MIWEASAARSFQQICFGHANDKYCPILLISAVSFPEICIEHLNIFPVIQAKESLNNLKWHTEVSRSVLGTNVPLSSIAGLWEPIRLTSTCHFLFLKAQIAFYTGDSQQSKANTQSQPSQQSYRVTAHLLDLEGICTQIPFLHFLEWESRNQVQRNKKENCLYVNPQTLWKHHRKSSYFLSQNLPYGEISSNAFF